MPAPRTPEDIRGEVEREREQLAAAVEHLRVQLGAAADVTGRLRARLPVLAAGAAGAGFVLSGGVGATMRLLARRSREGNEKARVGRWSLFDRD